MTISESLPSIFAVVAAALLSAGIIWAIRPLAPAVCARQAERAVVASHSDPARRRRRRDRGHAAGRRRHRGLRHGTGPEHPARDLRRGAVHRRGGICRRHQIHPGAAAAVAAGGGRCGAILFTTPGRCQDRCGLPALDRTRPAFACGPLVRESRQLHGRAGLDDGRRGRADHRRDGPPGLARRFSR